ncbi:uncharacterized protein ACBT44_012682 [Syngnathus typhle]
MIWSDTEGLKNYYGFYARPVLLYGALFHLRGWKSGAGARPGGCPGTVDGARTWLLRTPGHIPWSALPALWLEVGGQRSAAGCPGLVMGVGHCSYAVLLYGGPSHLHGSRAPLTVMKGVIDSPCENQWPPYGEVALDGLPTTARMRDLVCVLSPLLFTLLTHDCTATYSDNRIAKFADSTTLVGLITKGDETQYRLEVDLLNTWCRDNNILLNVDKTKEIVVGHTQHLPLTIDGAVVERVSSAKFLGVHISEDLSWSTNTASLAKKAQRRLYFLRKLRRASAPPAVMTTFYRGTIESVLSSCIAVWGGGCTDYNLKALQRIVNTAGKIIGASLPSLKDIYTYHLTRKATTIVSDVSHPCQTGTFYRSASGSPVTGSISQGGGTRP